MGVITKLYLVLKSTRPNIPMCFTSRGDFVKFQGMLRIIFHEIYGSFLSDAWMKFKYLLLMSADYIMHPYKLTLTNKKRSIPG